MQFDKFFVRYSFNLKSLMFPQFRYALRPNLLRSSFIVGVTNLDSLIIVSAFSYSSLVSPSSLSWLVASSFTHLVLTCMLDYSRTTSNSPHDDMLSVLQ